jgi:hypothetical protein
MKLNTLHVYVSTPDYLYLLPTILCLIHTGIIR